ncbi:similar to Saccharomyces cerevisiae YKR090W PXL1 LIM domain-containing protein that localizes to sites of polarized growth [Maudiozyma barnettii]|uniref:Similar to Saccharomyces cerevisiae YKR090W PXL1 LIM domain-containing protein that localizes to sites of polarized growth n=1 Tax=Maudiozyma barnettii TaxID=61262 RepID=A0A8H2ZHR0_9SACH|nr:Pxl1p [Kazachstania barnettii]CAB4256044.1 similar to Saccharomyces cerevisiae YKR090W PXL1 LIM domain-containing protein that localizes to sites of polarized growth [Kazachstania barnettii]CAD1784652.1 similar to Saccharomyces cerevisiae YKR090W PXL1 LIM domain-containing protein that localizes to sites of polarized growth [Kazachstania barnettii]
MYSGLYSSPFPKLNPNVRYRTVFERAGFDTNTTSSANANNSNASTTASLQIPSHQHDGQQVDNLTSGKNTPTKGIPMDGISMSTPAATTLYEKSHHQPNNQDEYRPINDRNRISPPQNKHVDIIPSPLHGDPYIAPVMTATSMPSASASSSSQHQQSQGSFNFEQKSVNGKTVEEEMNPIDRSFMMLTQNDSHSMISQSRANSNHDFDISNHVSQDSRKNFPSVGSSSHSSTSSHFKRLPSTVQGLNLEFKDPSQMMDEPSNIIQSSNTDSVSFEPDHLLTKQVSDEHSPEVTPIQLHLQQEVEQQDGHASDTIISKNLQVEQLIAELDDVSFSRNEQISQTLLSSHNESNSNSDVSLSSKTTSMIMEDPRLKKSSAYLSGFPLRKQDSSLPSKDSDGDSLNSELNSKVPAVIDGTPTFYKFAPKEERFSQQDSLKDKEIILTQKPEIIYPPGEGPCRLCGKDILDKGVFSKKENELSGQWHRDCFRCTNCSVKFNKKVPCYILNDKPYCQQHYHEENHSICQVCSRFIEGECLENDNMERFHIDCLKCFLCKKIIENDYFIFNDEVPICADHDMETLIENGLASGDFDNGNKNGDFDDVNANADLKRNNTLSKRRTRVISFMG